MPKGAEHAASQTEIENLVDHYSGCLQADGDLREGLESLRDEWPSQETSADAIFERASAKRMSPEEFDKHFGHPPAEGDG